MPKRRNAVSDLYRKYAKYPLIRRRRYVWRMNHDAWAWVFVAAMVAVFVILEWMR